MAPESRASRAEQALPLEKKGLSEMCDSGTNDKKVLAYKVTREADGNGKKSCTYRSMDAVADAEFDGAEPGDKIEIELVEMTEHELENLPEFEGW